MKQIGEDVILANLPSSQMYVPFPDNNLKEGCIDLPEVSFNCYCIGKGKSVTDTGYSFRLNTFIYGKWVEDYSVETLSLTYRVKDEDYEYCGKISDAMYREIIDCLKNSSSLKNKFRKMMQNW